MCFGPAASFVSSALLTGAGVSSLRLAPRGKSRILAAFPLLFGLHQGIEGLIWISESGSIPLFLKTTFILFYELIAFATWPILCPVSILALEPSRRSRNVIRLILAAGTALSLYLAYLTAIGPLTISTNGCSIEYDNIIPFPEHTALVYLIIISSPFLFTTQRYLITFGISLIIGWTICFYIDEYTFISVWCFLGALLSLLIYLHFKNDHQSSAEQEPK